MKRLKSTFWCFTSFERYQITTMVLLFVILGTTLSNQLLIKEPHPYQWLLIALVVIYVGTAMLGNRFKQSPVSLLVQSALTIAVMFGLYLILATLPFDIIPYNADGLLAGIDQVMGIGIRPSLWFEQFVTEPVLNLFSFFYAVFIPYLYFSIFLSLLGRPEYEKRIFITAFALTYSFSFLGYLFVPARGPVVFYQDQFANPLNGGYFHQLIVTSIEQCGGPHGAFPSLHVGASWFVCFFDLKFNRLRGLLYLPIVLGIVCATVLLRYHYVIDLVAGFFIATVSTQYACRRYGAVRSAQSAE